MPYKDPEKQKQAQKDWYLKNKKLVKERTAKQKRLLHEKIRSIKESSPCADCNQYYPYYIMQFDHVKGKKKDNISILMRTVSIKQVLEEIQKCELVCANCHHERTYRRYHQ